MCVAGYWADLDPDAARHFEVLTALLFACLGWLCFNVARSREPGEPPPAMPGAIA